MATTGGVEESLDFDFFESPRRETEGDNSTSPASKPPRHPETPEAERHKTAQGQGRSRSPPKDNGSATDSFSSDSDSHSGRAKNKVTPRGDKPRSRRSRSNSSLSSSASNSSPTGSPSRRSRSGSRGGSPRSHSSRSRSGSASSSGRERHRPSNPTPARTRQENLPKRGKSRLGEDEYSSSAYSEGEGSSSARSGRETRGAKDSGKKKQAWGDRSVPETNSRKKGGNSKQRTGERPKSAKTRGADRGRRSRSDSDALSDSDITDVSPMDSPRHDKPGNNRRVGAVSAAGDGSRKHKFMAMPVNGVELGDDGGDDGESRGRGGTSNLDLEILMKAVGELEKQKRVQANSRRVMFAPMGAQRDKSNYTFDQSKTRDIERENQRLLNEIVRRVNSTADQRKQFYATPATAYKLTPSAINRERDMKRIETENMAFLKRLQKVKPTSTICRDQQLRSYENTTFHGVPISALHPLPGRGASSRRRSGASSVADTASSIGSRTRSMTSIHSAVSSVRSSKRGSRPSSATVRPGSATKRLDTRPEWSDRW